MGILREQVDEVLEGIGTTCSFEQFKVVVAAMEDFFSQHGTRFFLLRLHISTWLDSANGLIESVENGSSWHLAMIPIHIYNLRSLPGYEID